MEIKNILTRQKPDAIFASDDLTAILVIKNRSELGISVPEEELKVIGYDEPTYRKLLPSTGYQATLEELPTSLLTYSCKNRRQELPQQAAAYQLHYYQEKYLIFFWKSLQTSSASPYCVDICNWLRQSYLQPQSSALNAT